MPIDYASGNRITGGGQGNFIEHFRLGADGRFNETQYQLIPQDEASAAASTSGGPIGAQPSSQGYWASAPREDEGVVNGRSFYPGPGPQSGYRGQGPQPYYAGQGPRGPQGQQPMARGLFGSFFWDGRAN